MTEREEPSGEPSPDGSAPPLLPGAETGQPRYEPPPSVGKLLVWVLLFVLAAVVVVLGGVYLT
ncbi:MULTISPECIES: hypothetical protein [unclassified Streptomyces]|uniref:hypothetical protein n=1 Tax=unclassified Streptomyces TaxID=2593676 RepID=UPI002DDB19F1|nr:MULTISPECIES: hypothetical protein [unclassified Streptomyces]WRZ41480.1 hypothetical protein OG915_27625 [Streptomyces sp. NBC_00151]